jgi:1,4-dihydroxy-2-naphthoyl-CoA hydrolase
MAAKTTTAGGAMHGGALMALADTIGGAVACLNLPEGAGTSTMSSSTVFLRGVRRGPARRPNDPDTGGAGAADWVT